MHLMKMQVQTKLNNDVPRPVVLKVGGIVPLGIVLRGRGWSKQRGQQEGKTIQMG